MPVVDEQRRCKGWLRLDLAFDWLHQGKVRLDFAVSQLRTLPCLTVKAEDSIEQALLQFAQSPDREVIVANERGELIEILALLDLIWLRLIVMKEVEDWKKRTAGGPNGGAGAPTSERQWGTVREDYSPNGTAWDYLTHDQARSRAYRWGEDGIGGLSDDTNASV